MEPSEGLAVQGDAMLRAWEVNKTNDENIAAARADSIAQKTLKDLKGQLETSSKALKKSKLLIMTLRTEKTKLKDQVVELTGANSSLEAALESTKSDALAISSSLSQVQGVVNRSRNDKDVVTIQYKETKKKLEEARELLVREKDSNAIMRHDMRELKGKLEDIEEVARAGEHKFDTLAERTAPNQNLVQELSTKNREISGSMAAIESELRTVRNESAALRQELLVKSETAAVLSAQLEAIQKKGTVVSHNDMKRYKLLETKLAKVMSRYEDLEKSLDAHNELLASEGRKSNKLRSDMAAMSAKEGEYKTTIGRMEIEIEAQKKHKQELIAKNALGKSKFRTRRVAGASTTKSMLDQTNEMLETLQSQQHDKAVKETLGRLASERQDYEHNAKKERQRRKQAEQTTNLLGTKVTYLQTELNDFKNKFARLHGEKELVAEQLKAQRAQNLHLHQRLGEIFDSEGVGVDKNKEAVQRGMAGSGDLIKDSRDVLERAVFDWHVKSSVEVGDGGLASSTKRLPTYEARFISENDIKTSTMLFAAREGNIWDVGIAENTKGGKRVSGSMKVKAEEMMQRFQMRQFMHQAQAQRDPERMWFMVAEKVAFVMTTALANEMAAGQMCSEVRLALADLASRLAVLKKEFMIAAERFEGERTSKHKSILKYVQESFRRGAGKAEESGEGEGGDGEGGGEGETKGAGAGAGLGEAEITLRLADSTLDDEICHGMTSLIMSNCPSCKDNWSYSGEEEDDWFGGGGNDVGKKEDGAFIQGIIMRDNYLGDSSAKSLTELLTRSKGLRLLDLRGNSLSAAGIATLKSAALANRTVDRVESRSGGMVLIAHKDVDLASDKEPLIIDCRHNDVQKADNALIYLNRASCEKLLEDIGKWSGRRGTKKLGEGEPGETERKTAGSTGRFGRVRRAGGLGRTRKQGKKLGAKKAGGFGSELVNYALMAPPSHMTLMKPSAFLTQGKEENMTSDRLIGRISGGGGVGAGGGDDSVANSAMAASDAPPGEMELGTLLDKKIKLMEKKRKQLQQKAGGGAGTRRWASSSGSGIARGRVRAGGGTGGGGGASRWARPKSATGTPGTTVFGRFRGSNNGSGITRPPKSTLGGGNTRTRPKSASMRRLPFRG